MFIWGPCARVDHKSKFTIFNNERLVKDLKEVFTDVNPVKRPIVGLPLTIDSNWLTGFIEGLTTPPKQQDKTKTGTQTHFRSLENILYRVLRRKILKIFVKQYP